MPQRILELYHLIELKFILPIGFFIGYVPDYRIDVFRIITSVLGTVIAGVVWIFLKPKVLQIRDKLAKKKGQK